MTLHESNDAGREAFVTMVTSDAYVVGTLVLAHSLRKAGTSRRLICMVTSSLAADSVAVLREVYEVRFVTSMDSGDAKNLRLLGRPELGPTFTKLQLWSFTDLEKVVFLDADMLILKNIDDLFAREELSACADVGWPDCFNSGLFVARPSLDTLGGLLELARSQGSFDGGDQGLLNTFFSTWSTGPSERRIPFLYNLTFNSCYGYKPAFERHREQVRAVHFIGATKPWNFNRFSDGQVAARGDGAAVHLEYVQAWWDLHDEFVKPKAQSDNPPSFMSLYQGSGFNPYHMRKQQEYGPAGGAPQGGAQLNQEFANYRIKWTDDVETFFQKRLTKIPSRKLVHAGDSEDDQSSYDSEDRAPIPRPSSSGLSR